MAKTLIEIDDEYLAAAQRALGTATKKDTVNAALREVGQRRVQSAVLLLVLEVGQRQRDPPSSILVTERPQALGMRLAVGVEEALALGRRKVADLEDRLDVLRRDRRRISRIGNLGDEAAVLAERLGQPLAHAGGSSLEHIL